MSDWLSADQRHLCMSHIRGKDTKPEIFVRKALWRLGFRYKLNDPKLPGKPDIVLPKYQTVIFINGCFWHGHPGCKKARIPATNEEFWKSKILSNINRDQLNISALEQAGWKVILVWECELSTKEKRAAAIEYLASEISKGQKKKGE